ncbi:PepSY domain-containing protein [Thiohalocapsa sp. ML1]|jgi:uncharacterized membrane protein YkoI|uniref:PepSY domain-containing protein n=1 Tax=Thiohalocapsa sp. ML1 TaxID=1431688 RepID=UPI00073241B9|nr:PepSY domain-containing protein [Thiohalocapsa sp. ML1]
MQPLLPTAARRARPWALLAVPLLLGSVDPAGTHEHDHDRARAALARGEVRPLAEILTVVHAAMPGDIVEVELEREHGRWVYELKVITPDGRRLEVLVDAATGTVLEHEEDD